MFGRYAGIRNARRSGALDVPRSASTTPRASPQLTALRTSRASGHQQFRCPKPRDGSRTRRPPGRHHHRLAARSAKTPRHGRLVPRGAPDSKARARARSRTANRSADRPKHVSETRRRACGRSQAAKQPRTSPMAWPSSAVAGRTKTSAECSADRSITRWPMRSGRRLRLRWSVPLRRRVSATRGSSLVSRLEPRRGQTQRWSGRAGGLVRQ